MTDPTAPDPAAPDHRLPGIPIERVQIFCDAADLPAIGALAAHPLVAGFTTNPTLMRAAGVTDYERFAHEALELVGGRPISFEVFSDELDEMERQARHLASWADNVFVKVPITNTRGESVGPVLRHLAADGIRVNVTALLTVAQVDDTVACLAGGPPAYISVFAGRIADAGVDPVPLMVDALKAMAPEPQLELIWASPREVFNIVQADGIGCHVITVTPALLDKLPSLGRDLDGFSLDTVRMFHDDARRAGYELDLPPS